MTFGQNRMRARLSELTRDTYSTSCEFREAARPCTHAVTIVRCHRGGRYVQTVDFSACQATAGATNVERPCSRGPDESVLSIPRLRRCGTGRGRPPRGVLFNDIAPRSSILGPWGEGVKHSLTVSAHPVLCGIVAFHIPHEHMPRLGPGAHAPGKHGDRQHAPHAGFPIRDRGEGGNARARNAASR